MKVDLKKYICTVPFNNVELHDKDNFMCCPSWLLKRLPGRDKVGYGMDLWNSEDAIEIRKSVSDGSFRHCDKTQCPYLSKLIAGNTEINVPPIVLKKDLPPLLKKYAERGDGIVEDGPTIVQFSFDRTCNYKCPSCRINLFTANGKKINDTKSRIEEIEENYGKSLKEIYITGSGDPFVSVSFRNFLRNFNPSKFPKLNKIHLHTNASMWTKEMWESMPNIHPYVKTCEISIDAGSEFTYENITRLGGNWNNLIENLQFINTLPNLFYIKTSFVVQSSNYKEMKPFLDLMKSIFGKKVHVFFGKINNWGTFNDGEFKLLKVWDETHPEHNEFVTEFNKVCLDSQVFHNMHEFVNLSKRGLI